MTTYISKEKFEQLKKELEERKIKIRADIGERLRIAKELGDLSENADYSAAKEDLAMNEKRISELANILKSAKIMDGSGEKCSSVSIGCKIKAKTEKGEIKNFTIVGAHDGDPSKNLISNTSPLGQAFIGRSAGEEIEFELPNGDKRKYQILEVN